MRGLIYFSTAMGVVGVGSIFAVGGAAAGALTRIAPNKVEAKAVSRG